MPTFSSPGEFQPAGDLWNRLNRNYARLEEQKYWPQNVYQGIKEEKRWPGDTEGRTLLAWIMLAQATGRAPRYLEEFQEKWPGKVNESGYFGRIYAPEISEQQLSSHGWVLRALAEWHAWQPDSPAREFARPVIENLFLPVAGTLAEYSIDPVEREEAGEFSGSHLKQIGPWILSTDVGCFAIGLAGVIDAFEAFGDERLIPLIDEMIARFLEIDLIAIKAQTHATLSACRGFLKWAHLRDRPELIEETARIYGIYTDTGITEAYANFNWFDRPKWTEPCAVVDGLMVAMELWRATGKTRYVQDAQLMYFNGLGHGQRANGGFGCDNCPGADGEDDLFFRTDESHWCCTMRGSEGLARLTQYQLAGREGKYHLPFGLPGTFTHGENRLKVETGYPHTAGWTLRNLGETPLELALCQAPWLTFAAPDASTVADWMIVSVQPGESREIHAELQTATRPLLNATTRFNPDLLGQEKFVHYRGPLLLADYAEQKPEAGEEEQPAELQPIFDDYTRNTMSKEASRKKLLHSPA